MNNSVHQAQIIQYLIDSKIPVANIEFLPKHNGEQVNYEQGDIVVTVALGKNSNQVKIKIRIGGWFKVESFEVCGSKNLAFTHINRANSFVAQLNKMRREFYAQHCIPTEPF